MTQMSFIQVLLMVASFSRSVDLIEHKKTEITC